MKILITGGVGNVGRALVDRLNKNGHKITVLGRRTGLTVEGADYQSCDVTDYSDLVEKATGHEGIIHLAAIPNPLHGNDEEIFRINCSGTFNVYQAAAKLGIKNIVSASSINALGFFFGVKTFPIEYFPVDEKHPSFTSDPYSFSKQIVESIGDYFWRRYDLPSVSIRLPWVYDLNNDYLKKMGRWKKLDSDLVNSMVNLPDQEVIRRGRKAVEMMAKFEFENTREGRASCEERRQKIVEQMDPLTRAFFFLVWGRANFWAALDARDSAQILENSLITEFTGAHQFFVCDSFNIAGVDTQWLLKAYFPEVNQRKYELTGCDSLLCLETARNMFKFSPQYRFPHPVRPYKL